MQLRALEDLNGILHVRVRHMHQVVHIIRLRPAAGIPEAGLVTMVIVLKAVNLPIDGIALILVIDWFLDRCRTTVNVWGDAVGAAVIAGLEKKKEA